MSHSTAVDLVEQRRFGHYEILKKLGAGGMGEVYRARDLALGRAVAIKVLRGAAFKDPERLARFEQEARSASALNHPNIVTIYEVGTVEDVRYIAMELVEGRTLREILSAGVLLTRPALQFAAQAAEGLAEAHAAGIVHRDLKPENIMVAQGRVKILDFGLAKVEPLAEIEGASTGTFESPATEPGRVLGTVGYMSPEQAMGRPLDFRSDQFSCGAILYEMVTGRPAFRRPTSAQTLAAIIEDDPEPIAAVNPAVPPPLRWIVERCLAKDPADRYASTRDMARDLSDVLGHLDEVSSGSSRAARAARSTPLRLLSQPVRRHGLFAASLALAALAAAGAWFVAQRQAPPAATPTVTPTHPSGRRAVAVLGFRNLSGQRETAWLSTAFSEMLTTELAAGGWLRTIPGEDVARMKMELSVSDAESLARDTLARVARNLGTDMVLLGSYVTLPGDRIRLDLRLQDVATGETVAALAESGTQTGLIDLVARAGSELRRSMGVEAAATAEASGLAAGTPSGVEAQRLYAEGLERLREFDALAARDLLQKAVEADPDSPMARVALADAWATLGYDARARQEAKSAFDLSARLPRDQRLAVEGRYRDASGEWARAIDIYGALIAFFPDNVEHGLRLAAAQSAAGRGREALDTLARIRRLPPPASEDPRIDLTEAIVARALGDFRREQAASSRAAEKGASRGARLLVARARLRESYALDRLGQIPEAARAAEEARAIFAAAGDRGGLAQVLNRIGSVAWNHGDLETAWTRWEEALAIRRRMGLRGGVAVSLHNLGLVLWERGDLAGARSRIEDGYSIDRELGDRPGMAVDLEAMAGLLLDLGDLSRAAQTAQQATALSREAGDPTQAALALTRLAMTLQAEGDLPAAKDRYQEALPVLRERGARDAVADVLFQLGELRKTADDLAGARKLHEEAQATRASFHGAFAVAKSGVALADLALEEGRPDAADSLLVPSVQVFAAQKAIGWEASAQTVRSLSFLRSRRTADARRAIDRALALSERSLSPHVRLAVAAAAARVEAAEGRVDRASARLEAALAEAVKVRLLGLQLELRLTRGEIRAASGGASDAASLRALADDARARGFGLVARKAETALGARGAR